MKIDMELCIQCEACVDNCPILAIYVDKKTELISIDAEKCIECGACIDACPRLAIK